MEGGWRGNFCDRIIEWWKRETCAWMRKGGYGEDAYENGGKKKMNEHTIGRYKNKDYHTNIHILIHQIMIAIFKHT